MFLCKNHGQNTKIAFPSGGRQEIREVFLEIGHHLAADRKMLGAHKISWQQRWVPFTSLSRKQWVHWYLLTLLALTVCADDVKDDTTKGCY